MKLSDIGILAINAFIDENIKIKIPDAKAYKITNLENYDENPKTKDKGNLSCIKIMILTEKNKIYNVYNVLLEFPYKTLETWYNNFQDHDEKKRNLLTLQSSYIERENFPLINLKKNFELAGLSGATLERAIFLYFKKTKTWEDKANIEEQEKWLGL